MQFSTVKIAWRNLGRNRKRTLLCVGAIAMAQFIVLFINCLMAGMFEDMLDVIMGPLVGHVQVHHKDWRDEQAIDLYIDNILTDASPSRARRSTLIDDTLAALIASPIWALVWVITYRRMGRWFPGECDA